MQDLKSILGRMLSDPPPPPEPTNHLPGTPGKVQVMAERLEARYAIWHPQDAKLGE